MNTEGEKSIPRQETANRLSSLEEFLSALWEKYGIALADGTTQLKADSVKIKNLDNALREKKPKSPEIEKSLLLHWLLAKVKQMEKNRTRLETAHNRNDLKSVQGLEAPIKSLETEICAIVRRLESRHRIGRQELTARLLQINQEL